jgi:murein L,D-transpeptidase YafK
MGCDDVSPWDEMMSRLPGRFLAVAMAFGLLSACADPEFHSSNSRHWVPLTSELLAAMQEKGMSKDDPVLIRTYKQEAEFEVWKKDTSGRYALLKTFPMCRWSGQLGPKRKEGDRQAPEGYYAITPAQLNPKSNYHLSYDMGYPNAYDRAHGGTGSYLMVHGDCSSAGCYSMTDKQIEEIYALVREAQSGGQKAVQMEAYPFRFTATNLARHRLDPNMPFWRNLKEGADRFEITRLEPKVGVCDGRYTFDREAKPGETAGCGKESDPELAAKVAEKERDDNAEVAELVSKGTPAVKIAYEDGGQHPSFRNKIAETSRPDAIAQGPVVELFDAKGALTKRAIQATGFDETAIAAAVTAVGSPETAATALATPAGAKPAAATVASAAAPAASSRPGATSATASAAAQAQPNATVVARREATPAAADAHLAFAAPSEGQAPASANKDQPFYQQVFAKLPKLPFVGSDDPPPSPPPDAANAQESPAMPLPPARPARLNNKDSGERGTSARANKATKQPSPQASPDKDAGQPSSTEGRVSKGTGQASSSPTSLARKTKPASSQAAPVADVDLLSSRPAYAGLPSFTKSSAAPATNASGFTPADQ